MSGYVKICKNPPASRDNPGGCPYRGRPLDVVLHFWPNTETRDGYENECKDCKKAKRLRRKLAARQQKGL